MSDDSISIDEAAALLNVGRDYLLQLLDARQLSAEGSGDARRISRAEVLAFKAERDARRREGLRELTRLSQEAGGYDDIE